MYRLRIQSEKGSTEHGLPTIEERDAVIGVSLGGPDDYCELEQYTDEGGNMQDRMVLVLGPRAPKDPGRVLSVKAKDVKAPQKGKGTKKAVKE